VMLTARDSCGNDAAMAGGRGFRWLRRQILFLPNIKGLNERNLRRVVSRIDWSEQRRMFQKIMDRLDRAGTRPDMRPA
jgi:hypothetical protein